LVDDAQAAEVWERLRASQSDPEWRERMDNAAAEFTGAYGTDLLDPTRGGTPESRAREAFEALQRFRARTLGERLGGRGQAAIAAYRAVTLSDLRRGLRAGELLIDVHPAKDTTIIFAVTRDRIAVWGASPIGPVWERMRRMRALVADPTSETPEL